MVVSSASAKPWREKKEWRTTPCDSDKELVSWGGIKGKRSLVKMCKEWEVGMEIGENVNRDEVEKLLSSVGDGWQISLIESMKGIFPSGNLVVGQALSCFLKLKYIKADTNDNTSRCWEELQTSLQSAGACISRKGFTARDNGFHNVVGPEKEKAVVLRVNSQYSAFYTCKEDLANEGLEDASEDLYKRQQLQELTQTASVYVLVARKDANEVTSTVSVNNAISSGQSSLLTTDQHKLKGKNDYEAIYTAYQLHRRWT
ncbi:trafficking protein particle complex subunit 8 isoform X1 [Tanacetum coccineum]